MMTAFHFPYLSAIIILFANTVIGFIVYISIIWDSYFVPDSTYFLINNSLGDRSIDSLALFIVELFS